MPDGSIDEAPHKRRLWQHAGFHACQGLLKQKKLCQTAILTPHKEMAVPDDSVEVSCKDTCGRVQGSTEAFEGKVWFCCSW